MTSLAISTSTLRNFRSENCIVTCGHRECSLCLSWKWIGTFVIAWCPNDSLPFTGTKMADQEDQKVPAPQLPSWRLVLSFIACCLLYALSFGSDFSSGIPYSVLVLEPCPTNQSSPGSRNESLEFQNQSWVTPIAAGRIAISTAQDSVDASQPRDSNISDSEPLCGGFGQGRSTTGKYHGGVSETATKHSLRYNARRVRF